MKAEVKSLDGGVSKNIDLPEIFSEEYRPDLIKKAVMALQSTRRQPHGIRSVCRYPFVCSRLGKRSRVIPRAPYQERLPRSQGPAGKRRA